MKIKLLQQGGVSAASFFVPYKPYTATSTASSSSSAAAITSSDKEATADLTDKDLITMLKSELDGLPNDVLAITKQLSNFYIDLAHSVTPGATASIESRYLKALSLAKEAKFNKEQYDAAYKRSESTGGINEVAIDENGLLICAAGDNFKKLTVQQYVQAKQLMPELHALTNQELLRLRARSPKLQFDGNIAAIVQNSIGMEAVGKLINDAVRTLGSDELRREGYTATEQNLIKQGIEYMQKALEQIDELGLDQNTTVDGLYNLGVMTKDLTKQALMALNYIYSTLPKNAKALLDMKAAESGMGSAKDIILLLLGSKVSRVNTLNLSRTNTPTKGDSSSSSSKKDAAKATDGLSIMDKLKLTPVMMALLGKSLREAVRIQNGTKYLMMINAQRVPVVKSSGEPLGAGVSLLDVSSSSFAGALDFNNATMGGQAIDPSAMDRVIVDSTNLYIMNLPFTLLADGTIVPDFKWLKTIETIDTAIRELNITDVDKINELYTNAGLPALMDSDGNLNIKSYRKFGVLNGRAASNTFGQADDLDIMAKEIEDETSISNYLNAVNKGRDKDSKVDFDSKSFWDSISPFWNSHDTLYEGTIFMPFNDNIINGAMSSNADLTGELASEILARNQQRERIAAAGGYHQADMTL